MAKMTFSGLDDIRAKLEARGARVEGTVNHMLNAGAKIVKEEQQQAMKDLGLVDTGDMVKSIKSEGIKKSEGGGKSVAVGPTGYDRKGVPNPLKAYAAQIGHSTRPARPWKTLAEEKAAPKVQERMREVFNTEMEKGGKGGTE